MSTSELDNAKIFAPAPDGHLNNFRIGAIPPKTNRNPCISGNSARNNLKFLFVFLLRVLYQPFQVIIPSGAKCSQAEKRPSGNNAA
jgi:hypothetical protein